MLVKARVREWTGGFEPYPRGSKHAQSKQAQSKQASKQAIAIATNGYKKQQIARNSNGNK